MFGRALDLGSSFLVSGLRLGAGIFTRQLGPRPAEPLELWEFESCPYCRRVREALTALDLEAIIYPCPRGGRFREHVRERGGREMFPFLRDPNTDTEMYESADIVSYLYKNYGAGSPPALGQSPLSIASSALATVARPGRGTFSKAAQAPKQPEQLLTLYNFEGSPYCRIVRDALCELELPYHLKNVGKNSPSRDEFVKRSGTMMVPFLIDPNTDTEMFESADIVSYLRATYSN